MVVLGEGAVSYAQGGPVVRRPETFEKKEADRAPPNGGMALAARPWCRVHHDSRLSFPYQP